MKGCLQNGFRIVMVRLRHETTRSTRFLLDPDPIRSFPGSDFEGSEEIKPFYKIEDLLFFHVL